MAGEKWPGESMPKIVPSRPRPIADCQPEELIALASKKAKELEERIEFAEENVLLMRVELANWRKLIQK